MNEQHVVVISMAPYRFGTRGRKMAAALSRDYSVSYVAMSKSGRAGRWDVAGRWTDNHVDVRQVRVKDLRVEPTIFNMAWNTLVSYLPAFARMTLEVLSIPAQTVIANGPSVLLPAIIHKLRYRSKLVLDLPERPGMVSAKGSLAALFSKFEGKLLKLTRKFLEIVLVVTYADVNTVKSMGISEVKLVRNVPMENWKASAKAPPIVGMATNEQCLKLVAMGSIFEGRGYENLLRAVALANHTRPVDLHICGPGRPAYLAKLRDITVSEGVKERVTFSDPVSSDQVSSVYLEADIGMVIYESLDPGNDGLSNKLFECVSSGRPVIASDLPENRRFVLGTGVGWLTGDTVASLSETILKAYDAKEIARLAGHCRYVGDHELSWENEIEPLRAVIQ